jgi:hypothetical protein
VTNTELLGLLLAVLALTIAAVSLGIALAA